MIDLHSHLLPAVDDGSRSVGQSVRVLEQLAATASPRSASRPTSARPSSRPDRRPAHDKAFDALRAAAPAVPRLFRGAEAMLDRPLPLDSPRCGAAPSEARSYLLVEFHRMVAFEPCATP